MDTLGATLLGYMDVTEVPGRGVCGLHQMMFTCALLVNIDDIGYGYRFCYHTLEEAREALSGWDGIGDPPGNWIVSKGFKTGDRKNPNYHRI